MSTNVGVCGFVAQEGARWDFLGGTEDVSSLLEGEDSTCAPDDVVGPSSYLRREGRVFSSSTTFLALRRYVHRYSKDGILVGLLLL